MAKIEEVTALLMDEISSFQKSVDELKKQVKIIQNHKIEIDHSKMKNSFDEFENKLNNNYNIENTQLEFIQNKLNKTAIFPSWMAILFSVFFISFILSIGFNFYQHKKTKEIENIAYNNGIQKMKDHMQLYFNKNPKTYKHFQKWQKNN